MAAVGQRHVGAHPERLGRRDGFCHDRRGLGLERQLDRSGFFKFEFDRAASAASATMAGSTGASIGASTGASTGVAAIATLGVSTIDDDRLGLGGRLGRGRRRHERSRAQRVEAIGGVLPLVGVLGDQRHQRPGVFRGAVQRQAATQGGAGVGVLAGFDLGAGLLQVRLRQLLLGVDQRRARLVVVRVDAQDLLDERHLLLGGLGQRGEAQPGDLVGRLEADDLGKVLPRRAHALVADRGDALLGELVDDLDAGPAGEGLGTGVGRVERAGALEIGEPLDRVTGKSGAGEPHLRRRWRLTNRLLQELVRFITAVGERRGGRLREDAVDRGRRGHVGSLLQIGHGRLGLLPPCLPKTSGVRREPLPPKQPWCHSSVPITIHVIA